MSVDEQSAMSVDEQSAMSVDDYQERKTMAGALESESGLRLRFRIDPAPAPELSCAELAELVPRLTVAGHFANANCTAAVAATFYSAAALAMTMSTDPARIRRPANRRGEGDTTGTSDDKLEGEVVQQIDPSQGW
jgi:hypothetical protein